MNEMRSLACYPRVEMLTMDENPQSYGRDDGLGVGNDVG